MSKQKSRGPVGGWRSRTITHDGTPGEWMHSSTLADVRILALMVADASTAYVEVWGWNSKHKKHVPYGIMTRTVHGFRFSQHEPSSQAVDEIPTEHEKTEQASRPRLTVIKGGKS